MNLHLYFEIAAGIALLMGVLCAWAVPEPTGDYFLGSVILAFLTALLWPLALLFIAVAIPTALFFGIARMVRNLGKIESSHRL